jgi:hypothetical protein
MAPEHPPELVIFDSRFEEEKLKGNLHYVEVPIGNRLRVRWDSEREPENFKPVGEGVAYVLKIDQLVELPVSRDSIPDDLGGLRYRWSEGLNFGIPWVMFVLILPSGHTLVAAEPMPARAKIFKGRLALYWILRADDLGRTQVECTLKAFEGSASSKLVELNRFCSGESPPLDGSIQIEDRSPSTSKRVFISYSHDSDTHREQVLGLSERLRADGIETLLDQYVNGAPPQGWPRWMLDQLDAADSVLVVCTETYYRRFRGHEEPGKGRGVDWEGALITNELYDARSRTVKFVPVLLSAAGENWIPEPLRSGTHFALTSQEAYENLYDFLLEQAGVEPHPIGTLKPKSRRKGTALTFVEPSSSEDARELISPEEFVDDRVRSAAIALNQARANQTLTMETLIGSLDRLFDRATFRGEPSVGLCPTQEWDYRLHGALQTLRLMQHYEPFVETESRPAWKRYRELAAEVSRYGERMAAYLFAPPVGLAELRGFVGTSEFINRIHEKKKWFEGGVDPETCRQIDPHLKNAIGQMEELRDEVLGTAESSGAISSSSTRPSREADAQSRESPDRGIRRC